ncbi:MAG TPA: ABC transporter ATP-binding protein [Spirochaetota bacterium]|nr:MAG: putative ABC transporter ATP-binding protein YlmA [Spirochaetes bacterium ADurb.BinA120]HPI15886.1 ABC transporter ATP-binding protein [Spirochaetota bacterium]HPO45733.1 ABC transporter ATP-binding protein [Spirochaetota bacterium]
MESVIRLENMSVVRGNGAILKNVNWTVRPGENWAVLGGNGSGKSFLLNVVSSGLFPSSGSVELFGLRLGETDVWSLRERIGMVSDLLQKSYNGKTTVEDVVCSGFFWSIGIYREITDAMRSAARSTAEGLSIGHLLERKFGELSHGEQKRVLIARALVNDPELLVLDEPAGGLDFPSREEFLMSVERLAGSGRTVIYVTHHVEEIMPSFNRCLLLKDGSVYAQGSRDEVLTERRLNEALGYDFALAEKDGRLWPRHF